MYAQKIEGTSLITVSVINYDSLVAPLFDAVSGQILVTAIVVIFVRYYSIYCVISYSAH